MQVLTPIDKLIITRVLESGGISSTSLMQIADELPADYLYALSRVRRLESLGCLCVQRVTRPGHRGFMLRLCCRCLVGAVGLDAIDPSCALMRPLAPAEG